MTPITPKAKASMTRIISVVCNHCGITSSDLVDHQFGYTRRTQKVITARRYITHLARDLTTLSYPEIAKALRLCSHTSVVAQHKAPVDPAYYSSLRVEILRNPFPELVLPPALLKESPHA